MKSIELPQRFSPHFLRQWKRQISVGDKSYKLSKLFLVMATQNPIEREGTYPARGAIGSFFVAC